MGNNDKSLAQDKVLILYILSRLQSDITESNLFKLVSPINNLNYFYFKQILSDLIELKLIGTYVQQEEESENKINFYSITSEGKKSLELTIDMLPGLAKLKADTIFKNERKNIVDEDSIITEYIPENEHSYTVKCKIKENNKTVFEVRAFAGSNEHAKQIADNWKENAQTLYPQMLDLLTGKK